MTTPAKAEATGTDLLTFEYDGETYEIPPSSEWDLEVLEQYEEGKIAATVRALLGEEQYLAKFKSKKRTVRDLTVLFEQIQRTIGVSGN